VDAATRVRTVPNFRRLLMACAAYPVGGRGVVEYADVDHGRLDNELLVQAEVWLGVTARRE
jgi:hypothetical protein